MILYKTGDPCPCCGQPIKLRRKADLYAFSAIVALLGLDRVGRTDEAIREAEAQREAISSGDEFPSFAAWAREAMR